MNRVFNTIRKIVPVSVATLVLFFAHTTMAAGTDPGGTAAGENVSNQATLNYEVGGVVQPTVLSDNDADPLNGINATVFVVDRKLDALVTELSGGYNSASTPTVGPGTTGAVLAYTVTNEGNEVQDFSVSGVPTTFDPFGGTDNFDATNVEVFVDVNGNGVYDPLIDTATFINELNYVGNAAGDPSSIVVFIVSDIPIGQTNDDIAAYALIAQVAEGGNASAQGADITTDDSAVADNPSLVQDVFADEANANNAADDVTDGIASSEDAYFVGAPTLSIAKSSAVISDPFTCPAGTCPPGANPKSIPGAFVEYTISVGNAAGSTTATNVNISDDLSGEIVGGGGTEYIDFVFGQYAGNDIELTMIVGGTPTVTNLTSPTDADAGEFVSNIVSVAIANLAGGDSAEVRFIVEIQ